MYITQYNDDKWQIAKQLCPSWQVPWCCDSSSHLSKMTRNFYNSQNSVLNLGMVRDNELCFLYVSLRSLGPPTLTLEK